jgi:hypothetical protein
MEIRFYEDPETGDPHIQQRYYRARGLGILSHPDEDRPGDDDSRVAVGQTNAGRCLRVIYVPDVRRG